MKVATKRLFIPGDEWLYYKIYLGTRTSEEFLVKEIQPITKRLLRDGIIDKWFFINYYDPNRHIRLRLHVMNKDNGAADTIKLLNRSLQVYIEKKICTNVEIGTYRREIERYGYNTIELFESLFYLNSVLIVQLLKLIEANPKKRWHFALFSINSLLDGWEFNVIERRNFFNILKESYFREMGGNKTTKKQLAKKFRANRIEITDAIESENFEIQKCLIQHNKSAKPIVDKIKEIILSGDAQDSFYFLDSYIHMHCNRLFASRQRMNEWIIYDFLYNYYRSKAAQENNLS